MMNQVYWKLQSTCAVNLKKRTKFISRVISNDNRRIWGAVVREVYNITTKLLWPSHGMIQLYDFIIGTANNKNFIVIKHKSVKGWNFRKKKKTLKFIWLNCFQWFTSAYPLSLSYEFFSCFQSLWLMSTQLYCIPHKQNIYRRNSYGQHGNDVSIASYHVRINKYRTDRPQNEILCPRYKSIIEKSSCNWWILIKSYVCA
jgi:hypothetical protein